MANIRFYLLLDHIKIQGANAISSPLTYGFPSIGGFLGAIHALNRQIEFEDEPVYLDGVLIASHRCDIQAYRPKPFSDYVFKLTRNPLGKDGKARAIIEEGKVNLDVSLVIEVRCSADALDSEEKKRAFSEYIKKRLMQQRIAGGSVFSVENADLYDVHHQYIDILKRLMPSFILMEAHEELREITEIHKKNNIKFTCLDVLIEMAKLKQNYSPEIKKWRTFSVKQGYGWLVPIHLGHQALSPLLEGKEINEIRNKNTKVHFVEAIYGLAKWIFPTRLKDEFQNAFWRYNVIATPENKNDVYTYQQNVNEE